MDSFAIAPTFVKSLGIIVRKLPPTILNAHIPSAALSKALSLSIGGISFCNEAKSFGGALYAAVLTIAASPAINDANPTPATPPIVPKIGVEHETLRDVATP
jgi:predicted outer membrane repeat protein